MVFSRFFNTDNTPKSDAAIAANTPKTQLAIPSVVNDNKQLAHLKKGYHRSSDNLIVGL